MHFHLEDDDEDEDDELNEETEGKEGAGFFGGKDAENPDYPAFRRDTERSRGKNNTPAFVNGSDGQ